MRPIGGYFELDSRGGGFPHDGGVLLNSGSLALRYAVCKLGIRTIWIPNFTCPIVSRRLAEEGCVVHVYEIGSDFMPKCDFAAGDFVVYNNWFGVMGKKVLQMMTRCPNLIVDNAQALFSNVVGRVAIYSPRKFVGVADGGIALFDNEMLNKRDEGLPEDVSCGRMSHVLKRIDYGASAAYVDYRENSKLLAHANVAAMSRVTESILRNIDYGTVAARRRANFVYLKKHLESTFPFAMSEDDVPLVYPYVTRDRGLRKRLIEQQIFVATYWPNVQGCDWHVNEVLPLPLDQRYGEEDMARIVSTIRSVERGHDGM